MSVKPETKLQRAIVRHLRSRGYWAEKMHGGPFQRAGLPDVLSIREGRAVWFEVKIPGGKVTPLQQETIDELRREAGCPAFVVHSVEEVDACLSL